MLRNWQIKLNWIGLIFRTKKPPVGEFYQNLTQCWSALWVSCYKVRVLHAHSAQLVSSLKDPCWTWVPVFVLVLTFRTRSWSSITPRSLPAAWAILFPATRLPTITEAGPTPTTAGGESTRGLWGLNKKSSVPLHWCELWVCFAYQAASGEV